mgnify:CR=1 FL=1
MTASVRPIPTSFVPPDADLGDAKIADSLFDELERRPIDTPGRLERWVLDAEELRAAVDEAGVVRQVALARRTSDAGAREAYERYLEEVREMATRRGKALDAKYLASPARARLDRDRWFVFDREVETRDALYREENVPLQTEVEKAVQDYDRLVGSMTVEWNGEETTIPRMAVHLHDPDRSVREAAWRTVSRRRVADAPELDRLFDALAGLRARLAANAGFADYQHFRFRELGRFDYTPADCRRFRDTVERVIVPLRQAANEDRRRRLGVDRLRPWDQFVDPDGLPPLAPFSEIPALVGGCRSILERLDPELAGQFEFLWSSELLDLDNRKDKAPGGFMEDYPLRRVPFIFMNATGLDDDVRTLLHESGHAFHSLASRAEPLYAYRRAPMEFAEVASMSMELLAIPHLEVFYAPPERRRSIVDQLRRILDTFVLTAVGDGFQDWLYFSPGHTPAERGRAWVDLQERFDPGLDWSGLEDLRPLTWQRVLHFYHAPFYYIEYAFAQIGALQVWLRQQEDARRAIEGYRKALALGGSRPLPDLFSAAGARFAFDEATLRPLAAAIERGAR